MASAAALSDAELRDKLLKFGVNPGPITATTRSVYEKKLARLTSSSSAGEETTVKKQRGKGGKEPATEPRSSRRSATRKSPARGSEIASIVRRKRAEASDSEEAEETTSVPEPRSSRRLSPGRADLPKRSAASDIIPGELNVSRRSSVGGAVDSLLKPAPLPVARKTPPSESGSILSSFSSKVFRTRRSDVSTKLSRDSLRYSDSDDDEEESPPRVDRSANTSFPVPSLSPPKSVSQSRYGYASETKEDVSSVSYLNGLNRGSVYSRNQMRPLAPRPYLSSYERSTATVPSRPVSSVSSVYRPPDPKKSLLFSVLLKLNKFRQEAMERLREKMFGRTATGATTGAEYGGRKDFFYSDRMRKGDTQWNLRGSYESRVSRQWSFQLPESTSRFIVAALVAFLTFIAIGYIVSVHRSKVALVYNLLTGAACDTANFIYSSMILPILTISLLLGLLLAAYWYQKYRYRRSVESRQQVFDMVDQIIKVLRKHHTEELKAGRVGDRENCLPVPHIRDMLIPPCERKILFPIWETAKDYVNENESRVQCETQFVGGQNCMVWRWVQPIGEYEDEKHWQGHAFSEDQVKLNSPIQPYSECLKLRGMFDPSLETEEDWPDHIQDALLEKLGSIRVMHMAVDRASKEGCVYMKLGSKEEAGLAFSQLHGSWFNNRLVSVKYLRTERYKERFPDAMRAAYPLEVKKPRHSLN